MSRNIQIIPVTASSVPCGSCKLCCTEDAIFLHPEHGDDPSRYQTEVIGNRLMLAHKPNGECIYLTDNGCGNYENRPAICKTFDCRGLVKNLGYTKARKLVKRGLVSNELMQRGRFLLQQGGSK